MKRLSMHTVNALVTEVNPHHCKDVENKGMRRAGLTLSWVSVPGIGSYDAGSGAVQPVVASVLATASTDAQEALTVGCVRSNECGMVLPVSLRGSV